VFQHLIISLTDSNVIPLKYVSNCAATGLKWASTK